MNEQGKPRIAVVAQLYPSATEPNRGTFVYSLVQELCRQDTSVMTIAPRCVHHGWQLPGSARGSYGQERATVLRPRFVAFSNRRLREGWSTAVWTASSFAGSVVRSARRLPFLPDVVYGHFLFYSGAGAVRLAERLGVPAVVAMGESEPGKIEGLFGINRMRDLANRCAGIVALSHQLQEYCVERLSVPNHRILLLPNATDSKRFYPRSRRRMREKLGLPQDMPIVAFTGLFNERKGPGRLLGALGRMPDVGAVFLGEGEQHPRGKNVLFAGRVPHDEVPDWLAAADLFVLPTLAEGSCNAIIEAFACGLPVVTSDIPEIREQVDGRATLLTPPGDIRTLEQAIRLLLDDSERRREMAEAALRHSQMYTLEDRVRTILDWIGGLVSRSPSSGSTLPVVS